MFIKSVSTSSSFVGGCAPYGGACGGGRTTATSGVISSPFGTEAFSQVSTQGGGCRPCHRHHHGGLGGFFRKIGDGIGHAFHGALSFGASLVGGAGGGGFSLGLGGMFGL